jgi:hypothetical protein
MTSVRAPAPNLAFEILPDLRLIVSWQTAANPTDVEWDEYCRAIWRARAGRPLRGYIVTEGGHPNIAQQRRLRAGLGPVSDPVAIVSSSSALRFVAAASRFFNPTVRCFSPDQGERAFAHLGLAPHEGVLVARVIERLRRRVLDADAGAATPVVPNGTRAPRSFDESGDVPITKASVAPSLPSRSHRAPRVSSGSVPGPAPSSMVRHPSSPPKRDDDPMSTTEYGTAGGARPGTTKRRA